MRSHTIHHWGRQLRQKRPMPGGSRLKCHMRWQSSVRCHLTLYSVERVCVRRGSFYFGPRSSRYTNNCKQKHRTSPAHSCKLGQSSTHWTNGIACVGPAEAVFSPAIIPELRLKYPLLSSVHCFRTGTLEPPHRTPSPQKKVRQDETGASG
jgi:hypothetical protein